MAHIKKRPKIYSKNHNNAVKSGKIIKENEKIIKKVKEEISN